MRMIRLKLAKKAFRFVALIIAFYLICQTLTIPEISLFSESFSEKIDWHDYDFINNEKTRKGPGERSGYELTDKDDIAKNDELFKIYGVSMIVSEKVSVSRSLKDVRYEKWKELKYSKYLPKASVSDRVWKMHLESVVLFSGDCDILQRTSDGSSALSPLHLQPVAEKSAPRNHPHE
jgi:hypothetical protein